jgi:hypothetical protein
MPNPQYSSPSLGLHLSLPFYKDWLQLAQNTKQYFELRKILRGIPQPWIEWAESQVVSYLLRGNEVRNPLEYRLSILWNGIVYLQESKYIGDIIENALRRGFIDYILDKQIDFPALKIPEWNKSCLSEKFKIYTKSQADFIIEYFTFYQLYGTMVENWLLACNSVPLKPGFRILFMKKGYCPDVHLFLRDMKLVKKARNDIAHTRKLFKANEVQDLYRIACKWLEPLDVNITDRILAYRKQRPKFLQDLKMPREK